ncbi:MAG: M14 family metallopeptidase [Phycisphaeraceae bacterium]
MNVLTGQQTLPQVSFAAFPDYGQITRFCRALAEARPHLCALSSLGPSREGRDIPLLTLTDRDTGPAGDKPAYLLHAAIHGNEVAGIPLALYTARQLLADHPERSDLLQRVAFHIVPVLNPDAAHLTATLSMPLRSRWDRAEKQPNTLYNEDINGDGMILRMRQPHPDGDHMQDPNEPRLVIPRRPNADEPFYRIWPEGFIHDFDGNVHNIRVEHHSLDWNRQWAHNWRPEPEQRGSGDFPFSEPEMRHLAEFLAAHTNLIGMVGYHTGAASILRPPSAGSVRDMVGGDHRLHDEIGRLGVEATGFPMFALSEGFGGAPARNTFHGHSLSYAYYQLGLVAFEVELGDIFDSAGFGRAERAACRNEDERIALLREVMKWWDAQPEAEREPLWVDWQPFDHPQLGRVEIGGFLVRHQYNQTLRCLKEIAPGLHQFCVHHASSAPRLVVEQCDVDEFGDGVRRIRISLANRGRLSTSVTARGKALRRMRTVRASLRLNEGAALLSRNGHVDLGHIDGPDGIADVEWFVRVSPDVPAPGGSIGRVDIMGGAAGNLTLSLP